jgi:hypothetical protein
MVYNIPPNSSETQYYGQVVSNPTSYHSLKFSSRKVYCLKVNYWLLVTIMRWYRTKHPMQLQQFSDLLWSPSEFQSFPIHPPQFPALVAADTPSNEAGRNLVRNVLSIFPTASLFIPLGLFNML